MTLFPPVSPGQILTGSLFNEPMRAVTVQANGPSSWVVGLVGMQSERFRKVTLTSDDFHRLRVLDAAVRVGARQGRFRDRSASASGGLKTMMDSAG